MANYKAGEITKEKILLALRELFYRNGFENTTYAQVSKKADVNIGTIVYHFRSLEEISRQIYDEIVQERAHIVKLKIKEAFPENGFNNAITSLAQYRINTQSYLDYPNYSRFITEQLFKSESWNSYAFENSLNDICREYNITINNDVRFLHKFLFLPFASLATSSVNNNHENYTAKQICDYLFVTRLQSLGLKDEEIAQIVNQVDEIADAVRLNVDELMFFS